MDIKLFDSELKVMGVLWDEGDTTAKHISDVLCGNATPEAVELAEDFKIELHKTHPLESDILVPNCIYRAGCPEFGCCGKIADFIKWAKDNNKEINWLNIQNRYDLYNEWFYEVHK